MFVCFTLDRFGLKWKKHAEESRKPKLTEILDKKSYTVHCPHFPMVNARVCFDRFNSHSFLF